MGLKIIVTAGPTNERIDSVMKITNMSTGSLGSIVADTLLADADIGGQVEELYYISPELARKPVTNDSRIIYCSIESAEDLKAKLEQLLTREKIDMVVHSAAVGDYKARYSVRGESLAEEIARRVTRLEPGDVKYAILEVLENPECAADDSGKMSSYEPNLMTMMDLTPKVIGTIKKTSPDTLLIGFKLLDGVPRDELLEVATKLREKNDADYIIANDLSKIRDGHHWAMFVGRNGMEREAYGKHDIANGICSIARKHFVARPVTEPIPAPLKHVVFVSIDNSERWGAWHSGPTSTVVRSELFDTKRQVEEFKKKVAADYPDSNLNNKNPWVITFIDTIVDPSDEENFTNLCHGMRSTGLYDGRL